jgi:hypothetical protein
MCIICLDFEKGRMTSQEARRALGEMVKKLDAKHVTEVEKTLREADDAATLAAQAAKP